MQSAVLSIRPDAARPLIRRAREKFEHARHCAADCRYQSGEPVPQSVADFWHIHALRAAYEYRQMARRAIIEAWPFEWQRARLLGGG